MGGLLGGVGGAVIDKLAPPVVSAASRALAPVLERFGVGSVASSGGFNASGARGAAAAGLDADNLPPELAAHVVSGSLRPRGLPRRRCERPQAPSSDCRSSAGQATQDPAALAAEGDVGGSFRPSCSRDRGGIRGRQAEAVAKSAQQLPRHGRR